MRGLQSRLSKYLTVKYKKPEHINKASAFHFRRWRWRLAQVLELRPLFFTMIVCFALRWNIKMIPLVVMFSGLDVVSNGWSIVIFGKGLKVFGFSIVKPSFSFTDGKTITILTIPAICSVNNSGLLWSINTVNQLIIRLINYHINDVLNKNRQHQHNNPVSTVHKKDIVILLPYLGLQSNQVAKRLKSCVYKCYSCVNLKIVFQSTRCIKSFFPYKDRTGYRVLGGAIAMD